jgi:TonB family protein
MQYKLIRTAAILSLLLFCTTAAYARDVSEAFIKTYRAYNSAYQQGDLQRAADLAQKSLEMAVKELGPDHEKIPVLLINLGHVNMLLGKYDDAEKYLSEAEKKIKPGQANAGSNLIAVHEDLANVYAGRKELDKTRTELKTAIDLRAKNNGPDDPLIADLYGMLARLDVADKKYDSAGKHIDQGMQIIVAKYGKDNNRVAGFLTMQGDLAMVENKPKNAEKSYLQAMGILRKNLVADDPNVLAMHKKLANMYIVMGSDKFASHADAYISHAELREGPALPAFIIKPRLPAGTKIANGWVLLNMTVTNQGRVEDLKVVESNVPAAVNQATLAAAEKWRFKPLIKDGKRLTQTNTRARLVFRGDKVEVHLGEMGQTAAP